MELRDYWSIVKRFFYLPLLAILLFSLFTWFDYKKQPITYSGSITFTSGNNSASPANTFNYEHYYNLVAAGTLADTISGWLSSPNTVAEIFTKAGLPVPQGKVLGLAKIIKPTKVSPTSAVVVATFSGNSREEVEKVLTSTGQVITSQVTSLQEKNAIPAEMSAVASSTTVIDNHKNLVTNLILSAIAGLIFGIILSFLAEALKP